MVNLIDVRSICRGVWSHLIILGLALAAGSMVAAADKPVEQVRSALGRGSLPWYDPASDDVFWRKVNEPPTPAPNPSSNRSAQTGWGSGDYLVFGGFVVALLVLVALVVRFWKRFEPQSDSLAASPRSPSRVQSGEVLPAGLRGLTATDDPWIEANRLRLAGDFAGAVVILFAHQLLSLARLGLVRLAPGRTGRQLHRSVVDQEFQAMLTPTLRQFEAVFYGHRAPTATDFADVWTSAEAFERRLADREVR